MAGHGGRLPSSVNGQLNDPGFVLPLSSHRLNGWRRFLTSLSPFVSRTSGRTLRVYARRLLTENGNTHNSIPVSSSPTGERHHNSNILGIWSSSDVHVGRRIDPMNTLNDQNSFISVPLQENENVVINIESNGPREHRRPSSPISNDASDNIFQASSGTASDAFDTNTVAANSDPEHSNVEDSHQVEGGHGLSINGEPITDILDRHPELKNVLKVIWQYFIFILIIIAKVIYDKFTSLLTVLIFFIGFVLSNKVIKVAVSHQERRSKRLTLVLFAVLASIPLGVYIFYHRASTHLYYSAMLLPSDSNFLSLGELLWIVVITDFVLKLSSVFIKGVYTLFPSVLLHYKNRGKHLAMIEFTSQLYRSLAPVQPWISYLLDNYTGIQKVFGVFLSAMYMFCKGPDIIYRVKNLHCIMEKFMQSSKYGSTPSKAELKDTGSLCPICQDDLVLPTMLQCKHIFCEQCVARWFDRERTCPMCRTKIADDPSYRDGSTSYSIQLY